MDWEPSWPRGQTATFGTVLEKIDEDVEGVVEVDYNAQPSGLVIDEDYQEGAEDGELVDEFNY